MKLFGPNIPMVISALVGIVMLSACKFPASNYDRVYTAPFAGHVHSGRHHRKPNLREPRHKQTVHPGDQKKRSRNIRDLHRARKKNELGRKTMHDKRTKRRPEINHVRGDGISDRKAKRDTAAKHRRVRAKGRIEPAREEPNDFSPYIKMGTQPAMP